MRFHISQSHVVHQPSFPVHSSSDRFLTPSVKAFSGTVLQCLYVLANDFVITEHFCEPIITANTLVSFLVELVSEDVNHLLKLAESKIGVEELSYCVVNVPSLRVSTLTDLYHL